jgi:hypothetical protein
MRFIMTKLLNMYFVHGLKCTFIVTFDTCCACIVMFYVYKLHTVLSYARGSAWNKEVSDDVPLGLVAVWTGS